MSVTYRIEFKDGKAATCPLPNPIDDAAALFYRKFGEDNVQQIQIKYGAGSWEDIEKRVDQK